MAGVEQKPQIQSVLWPELEVSAPKIEIPEPVVIVIADTKEGKGLIRVPQESPVEGVKFIVEDGGHVNLNKRRTRRAQADTDRIARHKRYEGTAKAARGRLVAIRKDQSDFAGIISERGNYRATLFQREREVQYEPQLLVESLGEYLHELIREEGQLVLTFPHVEGISTREQIVQFAEMFAQIMVNEGKDPQEVGTLINPTIIFRLDEERLKELKKDKKIRLKTGTRTSKMSWQVPIRALNSGVKPKDQKLTPNPIPQSQQE